MRRTLLLIPHEIAGISVFGFGWILLLLGIAFAARLFLAHRSDQKIGEVVASEGIMWGIVAIAVAFVLPVVELKNYVGDPVGMAVRGYGVMLLAGVASAVGLAAYRAKRRGIETDVIFSLAPWVFVGGIAGARIFYVIQYWDRFAGDSVLQTLRNMMAFTEGGLVVYGSFIGGFIAASIFILRNKLPLLKLGDAIVPCMFLGVFFGRIGCLMNGCCYGGRCEDGWAAIHFPAGSPVYSDQLANGELLGLKVNPVSKQIKSVVSGSMAESAGIQSGTTYEGIQTFKVDPAQARLDVPGEEVLPNVVASIDGRSYRWSADELPKTALPVQAAQLISSACSLVLCLVLCGLSLFLVRQGAIMMLGFAAYAILRFVLELVRVDEAGKFGTSLTISQWVSVIVLLLAVCGLAWVYKRPETPQTDVQSA